MTLSSNCKIDKHEIFTEYPIVTRSTLCNFSYPYKSKRIRLIKKWAKQNNYTYKKGFRATVHFIYAKPKGLGAFDVR